MPTSTDAVSLAAIGTNSRRKSCRQGRKRGKGWRSPAVEVQPSDPADENCPGDARWHPVKKCITHWLASFRPEFLRGLIHTGNGFNSGGSLRLQAVDGFGIAVFRQLRNSRESHIYRGFFQLADIGITDNRAHQRLIGRSEHRRLNAVGFAFSGNWMHG